MINYLKKLLPRKPKYRLRKRPALRHLKEQNLTDKTLVTIVSYRDTAKIKFLLDSLYKYKGGFPFDLLVVNNGKDAKIRRFLKDNKIKTIERSNTFRCNGGWNHAISLNPAYKYYLCLDDDTYAVRDNWLSSFISLFDNDAVGAVGNYYAEMKKFYHLGHRELENKIKEIFIANKILNNKDGSIDHLQASAIMLKNAALQKAGLWAIFNPHDAFATILAETEMSIRLRQKGYTLRALPQVSFGHKDYLYETLPK